jgi:dTDP-4-amino-4,6-dideoxygalactose transaminase
MVDRPAVLGNAPVFEQKLPIVRPALPAFEEMAGGVQEILSSGMVTKGRYLREFEAALAEHLGVRHAIGVSSCTSGLMLVYRGLGLEGEVVVPSFTFMATVSALIWSGLRPVFADVEFGTTNLDPARAEAAITPRTSALVAVHNFGNPADVAGLEAVARRHGLKLVFDAAHGFGSLYRGVPVGRQGDAQVFSLSPTKLVVGGEGGIVATDDDALAEAVRTGREYGNAGNYDSAFAGLNARLGEFNALLGLHSLDRLEAGVARRNEIAAAFGAELGALPGVGLVAVDPRDRCSWKDFSITVDGAAFGLSRDQLARALAAENVDVRKYYDPPVHRHTAYRAYAPGDGRLPETELLAARSLSLPIWSHMDDGIVAGICRAVTRIAAHAAQVAEALP